MCYMCVWASKLTSCIIVDQKTWHTRVGMAVPRGRGILGLLEQLHELSTWLADSLTLVWPRHDKETEADAEAQDSEPEVSFGVSL